MNSIGVFCWIYFYSGNLRNFDGTGFLCSGQDSEQLLFSEKGKDSIVVFSPGNFHNFAGTVSMLPEKN